MKSVEWQRLLSILGALLVGLWLPLRMVGIEPPFSLNLVFFLLISVLSINNIILSFRDNALTFKSAKNWRRLDVVIDLLCLFPLSLIQFLLVGEMSNALLLVNLACVRHIRQIRRFLDQFDQLGPTVFRLIPVFVSLPILVHLLACGWIALGEGNAEPTADVIMRYVRAWYWTMTTLTTVGFGDIVPKTVSQMIYAGAVQLAGVGVFGYIVSNVATVLQRSDAAREHHMDSVDRVEMFMNMHAITPKLRQSVRTYFHYLWTHKRGYQERSVIHDLPAKMRSEIFYEINRSIVSKVDFLREASSELIEELMLQLEPMIFVPGERIFRVDEPGLALYFIHSGVVEIRSRENALVATLEDGQFFGEMALLSDRPRGATARAATYCEVYLLRKESFLSAMRTFPEFKASVEKIAQSRQ